MIARTLTAAALGAALSAAAPAAWSAPTPPIGDPAAFVERAYHRLEAEPTLAPPEDIYTPRIMALKAAMVRDAHGEVPRIDFEWWTDAQDLTITDSHVRAKPVFGRPDREVVIATFRNEGRPAEIRFTLKWL